MLELQTSQKIVLYVPSRCGAAQEVNTELQKMVTDAIARQLAHDFGGATIIEGTGYYENNDGEMIVEAVKLINVQCDTSKINSLIEHAQAHATYIKSEMQQECVTLEINGTMYFI